MWLVHHKALWMGEGLVAFHYLMILLCIAKDLPLQHCIYMKS